jgi:hypothetical protein
VKSGLPVLRLLLLLRRVGRRRLLLLGRVHADALVAWHRRGGARRCGDAPPPSVRRTAPAKPAAERGAESRAAGASQPKSKRVHEKKSAPLMTAVTPQRSAAGRL